MRTAAPHPALAPFVRDLMIVEVGNEVRRVHLPEPGLVLAVRYRGFATVDDQRVPDVALTGVTPRVRDMCTSANGGVVLVRFRPGGAARFFAEPLHELLGASTPLADLVSPHAVARVHRRVGEARRDDERIRAVEELLLARPLRSPDALVAAAIERLRDPTTSVRTVAAALGLSVDAFEKRFRRTVGCSPKQFASLVRLRTAVDRYRPGTSLTELALDVGYYDQAHFNRALRAATGQAPREFFAAHHERDSTR